MRQTSFGVSVPDFVRTFDPDTAPDASAKAAARFFRASSSAFATASASFLALASAAALAFAAAAFCASAPVRRRRAVGVDVVAMIQYEGTACLHTVQYEL